MSDKNKASFQSRVSDFSKTFDRMPVHHETSYSPKDQSADLIEMGFVIHDKYDLAHWERYAPILRVTPPAGWSLRHQEGYDSIAILDHKDRERGFITLGETANGEMHGSLTLYTRYLIGAVNLDAQGNPTDDPMIEPSAYAAAVRDFSLNYKPVFVLDTVLDHPVMTPKFIASERYIEFHQSLVKLREAAIPWLNTHYPHWRSPAYYWD